MSKDREILKELEKEIRTQLPQLKPNDIGISPNPGYAVDERGYVGPSQLARHLFSFLVPGGA